MIDFSEAIATATTNAQQLLKNASNFQLEEAVLSEDNKRYEVTISYDLNGRDPLSIANPKAQVPGGSLMQLAKLMSYRKEYKVFYVDRETGGFKGFRNKSSK